jgi:hypothetical protein
LTATGAAVEFLIARAKRRYSARVLQGIDLPQG